MLVRELDEPFETSVFADVDFNVLELRPMHAEREHASNPISVPTSIMFICFVGLRNFRQSQEKSDVAVALKFCGLNRFKNILCMQRPQEARGKLF